MSKISKIIDFFDNFKSLRRLRLQRVYLEHLKNVTTFFFTIPGSRTNKNPNKQDFLARDKTFL